MTDNLETTRASKILFFLLCATVIFTTLAYGTVHQPSIIVFYLIAVLIVLLWALDAFSSGVLRFNKNLIQIPLIALFLYGLIQIIPFGSVEETAGIDGIPRTISLEPFWTRVTALHVLAFAIFLAAWLTFLDSAKRIKKLVSVITIFGFVYAFFAILQTVLSPGKVYGIYEATTPFGSFVNRHNFAAYMEMTICLPLGLMFVGAVEKDRRLLYVTAIGLMGIALLLSGSRGGLISLLAEIFFLIILTTKTKSSGQLFLKIGLAVLLVTTIVAGSILIGGESSLTRFAETANSDNFSTDRLHIWSVTLDIIKSHPIFGTGLGGYAVAYTPFDDLNGIFRVEQAHNDYLQVLADAGIFGLIIGAFFLYRLFRTGLRNAQSSNSFRRGIAAGALAGCFAILVHSLFDFVLHTTAITMLFVTLIAMVVVSGYRFSARDDADEIPRRGREKKRRSAVITPINKGRKTIEG